MLSLIRSYLKGSALLCALLAPVCMFAEVLMDLQQPTLMARIIDLGIRAGDANYVLRTGAIMLLCALGGLLGGAGCSILATYASLHCGANLREDLFAKIQNLSFPELDHLETSSLVTRLTNDVVQIQDMVLLLLRTMTRSPMLCIGGILMSFLLDARLAIILCAALPVLIACTLVIVRRTIPLYAKLQQALDQVNTSTREDLLGIRVVKAFTLEQSQADLFQQANAQLARRGITAQRTTFLLMPLVTLVMNLSVIAVLWLGGGLHRTGTLDTGKIMAFVNYMIQITNALMMMVNFMVSFSRAQASSQRVRQVLAATPSVTAPSRPIRPAGHDLELSHVSFRYHTGKPVLQDITFTVHAGEKLGIIGATGSGKSTLAALMARLYDPDEGSITIGGVPLSRISLEELRHTVGLVFQQSLLFSGTVAENLRYGAPDASDEILWQACEAADAADFLQKAPEKLVGPVEQRGKNFSGGQRQRLCIARTLVQRPQILLLDDTTSAVDLVTEARLMASLRRYMAGSTIVMIAQRISSIMDCDTILLLDSGRLIAQGSHKKLLETCSAYRSLAVSQLGEEVLRHA